MQDADACSEASAQAEISINTPEEYAQAPFVDLSFARGFPTKRMADDRDRALAQKLWDLEQAERHSRPKRGR
jgi:hypothetical protein